MIDRLLKNELLTQLREYPIVTVIGPRQAGKTTLVRSTLPDFDYVTLENPEMRQLAIDDFLRCAKEMALNMMRALEGPAMAAPSEPMMVPSVVIVPSSLSLSN